MAVNENGFGSIPNKELKIMTWNINGIRAVTKGKSLKKFLDSLDADILCFQETKITRDMLEESICTVEGYNAYFSFSRVKTGYSGVATFCKNKTSTPCAAEEGITSTWTREPSIGCYGDTDCFTTEQLTSLDREGRAVLTEHTLENGEQLVLINVYCPRADTDNDERMEFKMRYYKLLQIRVEALVASGSDHGGVFQTKVQHVIVLGDLNLAHRPIDHCNPGDHEKFNAYPSRVWMSQFIKDVTVKDALQAKKKLETTSTLYSPYFKRCKEIEEEKETSEDRKILVDSFRYIYPLQKDAFTNWCTSTGARLTNYGNRLDYIVADLSLVKQKFVDVCIRPEVEGSDHCPVVASLSGRIIPPKRPPALCTRFMPEFAGKQQKLASYFIPKVLESSTESPEDKETDSEENSSGENTSKNQIEIRLSKLKGGISLKRTGSFEENPQAKRPKTSESAKKANIFQFFEKKPLSLLSSCDNGKVEEKPVDSQTICNNESSTDATELFENSPKSQSSTESTGDDKSTDVALWKNILKGPPPAPLCTGHNEPCVLRTVKKKGPNYGRQFHCCARPEGHYSNKDARCKFFKWTR